MNCKFCNRKNTKYSRVYLVWKPCLQCFAVPVDESQVEYGEQNYQFGKCPNGACERLKDKIKEKDVVTQSSKGKGTIFGYLLGHGILESSNKPFKFKSMCDSSTVLSCTFVIFK